MALCKLSRRRRFTILKFVLITLAVSGVMFWFNQVWSSPVNNMNEEEIGDTTQKSYIFPNEVQKLKKTLRREKKIDHPTSDKFMNYVDDKNSNALDIKGAKQILPENVKTFETKSALNLIETFQHDAAQISPPYKFVPILDHNSRHTTIDNYRKSQNYSDKFMKVTPGLGEKGAPVILSEEEQKLADEAFNSAAFNVFISDRIALNRSLPDPRNPKCKYVHYDRDLPDASVIIIFTNEVWSALLRTIYSVINRSPSHLLHEIILVDDYSDKDYLKYDLKEYIQNNFSPNLVKLIRLENRQGLIRARLAGAKVATGKVMVFLDSHCEANEEWLEPLLQRIKESRKAVLCPIIDVIDDKTLEYYGNNLEYFQIGGFTWNGHFTWIEIPEWEEKRKKTAIDPTRSPTMAGGLFAIERNYFWEIGSYDSGMDIWGGENLEMSFRVWMCGGTLEIVPCSHVGHIFRSFHPYIFPGNKDTHGINTVRTVEVWMDEYKKYFYMYRHDLQNVDYGSISERTNLKRKLHCKSFSWFLENIYPQKFILDKKVYAFGIVKNPITNLCLDTLNRDEDRIEPLGLFQCHNMQRAVMNQMLSLSNEGELRKEENCAEVTADDIKTWLPVVMTKCHGKKENQEWIHNKGGPIVHLQTGKCLDVYRKSAEDDAFVTNCNGGHTQIWWFENYAGITLDVEHEV